MTVCETNGGGKREKYIRESREEDQPSLLAIWIIHVQNYVDIHEYMDVPPNVPRNTSINNERQRRSHNSTSVFYLGEKKPKAVRSNRWHIMVHYYSAILAWEKIAYVCPCVTRLD